MTNRPCTPLTAPSHLDALANDLRAGKTTARALVEGSLARIAEVDEAVQAWISTTPEAALAAADTLDAEAARGVWRGPLHGIPFAVKDVIDLEGVPTRAGSAARADVPPARLDATVVLRLRAQGAIPLGKVHTTEFAYFDGTPPTRNPHDLRCTPGGSSAGSAAAVASGTVPFALGTQTAGSVNRPAAFCGLGAFKPSGLTVVGAGVVPLSPSFDTLGVLAARGCDAARVIAAMAPEALGLSAVPDGPGARAVALIEDPLITARMGPAMGEALAALATRLEAAGLPLRPFRPSVSFQHLLDLHRTVLLYELGRTHAGLLDAPTSISPRLAEDIRKGLALPRSDHSNATAALIEARARFWVDLPPGSVILAPATPGTAPRGMATGDPNLIIPFTALAGPIASVPADPCPETGLPLGALLATPPGQDLALATTVCHLNL